MKQVHLIGDSHVLMYKALKDIEVHHFGACTAYSLMDEHSQTKSFQTLRDFVRDKSPYDHTIIFGFGEIDCRVLIYYKMIEYNIPMNDMIDIVIYRYCAAISWIKDKGFDVAVHGIVPAVQQGNEYNLKYYADPEIRGVINWRFCKFLQYKCLNDNIPYFDSYSKLHELVGEKQVIPKELLLPDLVHVDPDKVPVIERFSNWLKKRNMI